IKLAQRLAEFRQVEMPIYIADYQALENEIKKISEHIKGSQKKRQIKKELFDDFAEDKISSAARRISPSRNADLHSGLSSIGK
ncbi:hypothetical protein CQA20_29375, partial [Klebsiella pneumoniae]